MARESSIEPSQRRLLKSSSLRYHSSRKRYHLRISASIFGTIYGYQIRYHPEKSKADDPRDTNHVFGKFYDPLIADSMIHRPDSA